MKAIFFKTQSDFHRWLEQHHASEKELLVGFYKKDSGKPSITYQEALDEALCFGWIDGIRKSIDDVSYSIRFTPRKLRSIWSAVNIKRVGELTKLGLMQPAGLVLFNQRDPKKAELYSFERKSVKLDAEFEKRFKANKKAWEFFQSKPLSYQKPAIWWVMSAKKEETRQKRLETLIQDSARGRTIPPLTRPTQSQ